MCVLLCSSSCHVCCFFFFCVFFFFFKQKTAYEMRISDWSSDVCSSDLLQPAVAGQHRLQQFAPRRAEIAAAELAPHLAMDDKLRRAEIGRASCRERVCQYV